MLLYDVCLSDVGLSRTSGLIREQRRPRKTKIGTEVPHVTRDSDTTFKVKRSKVKVTRRFAHRRVGASGGCSGGRENVLAVGNCCYTLPYARRRKALRRLRRGRGAGAYRGGRPPTTCLYSIYLLNTGLNQMALDILGHSGSDSKICDVSTLMSNKVYDGAGMLFTTHCYEAWLTELPPCIQQLSWKA